MRPEDDRDLLPSLGSSQFDVVRRGYDRDQVDDTIDALQADMQILAADRDATTSQAGALVQALDSARREIGELHGQLHRASRAPINTRGMSERLQRMLRLAQDEAAEIRARAESVAAQTQARAQQEAVRALAAQDRRGLCLRVSQADRPRLASGEVLDRLWVIPAEVDLVLTVSGARPVVESLPGLGDWRSLIVAGTSFPRPSDLLGDGLAEWPRSEWATYEQFWARAPAVIRRPDFGDWGVTHPDSFAAPHRTAVRVVLRYSTPDKWLVGRGGLYSSPGGRSPGASAVQPVAQQLWDHAEFERAHHCAMEAWVVRVAWSGTGGGNPMTWHRYATHHHVVRVTDQLRGLGVPSTPQDLREPS